MNREKTTTMLERIYAGASSSEGTKMKNDDKHAAGPEKASGTAVMGPFVPRSEFTNDEQLVCKDCQLPVVPTAVGVRLVNKSNRVYQCSKCHNACVVLNYALGGWPTEEFKTWHPETEVNFFRRGLSGSAVTREYAMTCAEKHCERRIDQTKGEMRPL